MILKKVIVFIVVITGMATVALVLVNSQTHLYRSTSKILLENEDGIMNSELFKGLEHMPRLSPIGSQVELIQSHRNINKLLDTLKLNAFVYGIKENRKTFLGTESPIFFERIGESMTGAKLNVQLLKDHCYIEIPDSNMHFKVNIGDSLNIYDSKLIIQPYNLEDLEFNQVSVYVPRIEEVARYIGDRVSVTVGNEDNPVVAISYTDEHPAFCKKVVDNITALYLDNHVQYRTKASNIASEIVNNKIAEVEDELLIIEEKIREYKVEKGISTPSIRENQLLNQVTTLKIELIRIESELKAITQLKNNLLKGSYFEETAINFGYGDLVLTELVKKIQGLSEERRVLLSKYTEDHDKIKTIDASLIETKNYIKESVFQNISFLEQQKSTVENSIAQLELQYSQIPTYQNHISKLLRDYKALEATYTFLFRKKIDSDIPYFNEPLSHRVIQEASMPIDSINPKPIVVYLVISLFSVFLIALSFFLINKLYGQISTISQLKALVNSRNVLNFSKGDCGQDSMNLYELLSVWRGSKDKYMISFTSCEPKEGKSYCSQSFSIDLARRGYKVLMLAFDTDFNGLGIEGLDVVELHNDDFELNKESLFKVYDFVVLDSSSLQENTNAIKLMNQSCINVVIYRRHYTKLSNIKNSVELFKSLRIYPDAYILNCQRKKQNYLGWNV